MSAAAGAAVYLAASQIGKDKLKLTGLFVLASASMAGMVTAKASAKAYSVEARLNAHVAATAPAVSLQASGGTINGTLSMSSNDITNIAHIAPATIGPGGTRAGLSFTDDGDLTGQSSSWELAAQNRINHLRDHCVDLKDRCNWLNTQLANANINY
jgi:hypothetical protein